MELKDKIQQQSLQLFLTQGVKSINMDDVASHLGVSKKTLYKFVNNKSELVDLAFLCHRQNIENAILHSSQQNLNAIDEVFLIDEGICFLMKDRHPSVVWDLKKYYPSAWEIMISIKEDVFKKVLVNNISRGIEQKLFREDVNADLIVKLMLSRIDVLVDERVFPSKEYNFTDLLAQNRSYHLRGIVSAKGLKYLEEKLKS
jgi:AcrR family transcriptional regulator